MGEGIFHQMQKGNIYNYNKLTKDDLSKVIYEIFRGPELKGLLNDLYYNKSFNNAQKDNIKRLLRSELEDDYILGEEIINTLKNK